MINGNRITSHVLPSSGSVAIGRALSADVRIDHPAISRQHLVLELGDPIRVRDLGSRNGVRVGGRKLAAEEVIAVEAGAILEADTVMMVLQRTHASPHQPATETVALPPRAAWSGDFAPVVVDHSSMGQLWQLLRRVAASDLAVLITGETGVGKDVMAEAIHRASPRADKPLVRLNCASLSPSLLESELFGHERGAFTGAVTSKPGLLEQARGGTAFFDEIGELPVELQSKLLRVLEDRKARRVGGLKEYPLDVRFVSATNIELDAALAAGKFRRDLYYRLNGVQLAVPPLRERVSEIAPLARAFVARACERLKRTSQPEISDAALAALEAYTWPGNVRELKNAVERAVALAEGAIEVEHLGLAPSAAPAPLSEPVAPPGGDDERARLLAALAHTHGNQKEAARLLGIARSTLVKRLETYGLPRPRKR